MTDSRLFYAYAKDINNDWASRYLIVFATRDVADNWWRAITDSVASGYQRFAGVQRVTPQFYTHNHGSASISDTITDNQVAKQYLSQIFFTLLVDKDGRKISIPPALNYSLTDHLNGGKYFVRSAVQLDTYWYYDTGINRIITSRNFRTRFIIRLSDSQKLDNVVMIGGDNILISLTSGAYVGVVGSCNDPSKPNTFWGELTVQKAGQAFFKFSDFKDNFKVDYGNAPCANTVSSSPGAGERWEIVA